MFGERILISNSFTSQKNDIFIPGESMTIGNPLCVALGKNLEKCEIVSCNEDKVNKGIRFSIRATPGNSAAVIFREQVENAILETREVVQKFKEEYTRAVKNSEIVDSQGICGSFTRFNLPHPKTER